MPIGRRPSVAGGMGFLVPPGAFAKGMIRTGAAVALVSIGGAPRIVECSNGFHGEHFQGFAATAVADGDPVAIVTIRGSTVTPIVEGGAALTPGSPLFLSQTPGEVTATAPTGGILLRVGDAITATAMFLNTDQRVGLIT